MKTIALFFSTLCVIASIGRSQPTNPPQIEWQRSFGGSGGDYASCIRQTSDGGFIVGGYSDSPISGNKTSTNFGSLDFWILRLDRDGNRIWERSFGGTDFDLPGPGCLLETADHGFVIAGSSRSSNTNGNKSAPNHGGNDFWVVRLDADGNKLWDRTYDRASSENARCLQQTIDGGFIVGGWLNTTTNIDAWIVRLDRDGNELWNQTFGGSSNDEFFGMQQLSDGGFMFAGRSSSPPSGTKTSTNFGFYSYDFWLVRLDANGNQLWDKSFGGDLEDDLSCLRQTSDGGFILGGYSASTPSGNKTSPMFGGIFGDFWVVRLDANGNKLWDQSFGGTGLELLDELQQTTDGGFILGGRSASGPDTNKTSAFFGGSFSGDCWMVRLDAQGNKMWEQSFGGTDNDGLQSLQQTRDGGFILGASSSSPADGNKTTAPFGGSDFWIIKLGPEAPSAPRLRPQLQSFEDIGQNGYRFFLLSGVSSQTYVTEYSEDLITWRPFQTNQIASGEIEITHITGESAVQRFYRARTLP